MAAIGAVLARAPLVVANAGARTGVQAVAQVGRAAVQVGENVAKTAGTDLTNLTKEVGGELGSNLLQNVSGLLGGGQGGSPGAGNALNALSFALDGNPINMGLDLAAQQLSAQAQKAFEWIVKWTGMTLKFIFEPVILFFYAFGLNLVVNSEIIVHDLFKTQYDPEEMSHRSPFASLGPFEVIILWLDEFKNLLLELFVIYLGFVSLFFPIALFTVLYAGIAFLTWYFQPYLFIAAQWIAGSLPPILNAGATIYNTFRPLISPAVETWNSFLDFFVVVWNIIGSLVNWQILSTFVQTSWNLFIEIATLVWTGGQDMFAAIGSGLCPTPVQDPSNPSNTLQQCLPYVCQRVLGVNVCYADTLFILRLIFFLITDFILFWLWCLILLLVGILNFLRTFWINFRYIFIRSSILTQLGLPADFQNTITTALDSLNNVPDISSFAVPTTVSPIQQMWEVALNIWGGIIWVFANTMASFMGAFESVVCNIINMKDCFALKACYIALYNLKALPLRDWICGLQLSSDNPQGSIGLIQGNPLVCPYTCDRCKFKPFNIPVNPDPWWINSNYVWGNAGAWVMYVPCDYTGTCCNYAYTLFAKAASIVIY